MSCRQNHRRAGFTLVEMLVVLAILAITTTIAVQSLAPVANEARYEATRRTLDDAANSIISTNKSTVSGFLADTGRLPVYSASVSAAPYSVDELTGFYPASATYGPPADVGTYQPVAVPMTAYTNSTTTTSTTLTVNSGWNGPYLLAPSGSYAATSTTSIVDGWQQALPAFVFPDASNGNGMTVWSMGDPTASPLVPVKKTLVPSLLNASSLVLNGCNSAGVAASPTWGTAPYYYAMYGPTPHGAFSAAPASIAAGTYEAATSITAPPAVYQHVVAYQQSLSVPVGLVAGATGATVPLPGLGPRVFCILDSLGKIVSGPIYQVILPGSNTVNFLVQ